jgi:hypothetical protein
MARRALVLVLLLAGVAHAQPTVVPPPLALGAPEVSAAANPTAVQLGRTFTLFVTAAFEDGVEVNLREPMELGPAFEVRRKDARDTVRADGKREREWQLQVIAWDLGDLMVPPVAVTFTYGGHAGQVETNAVPIQVTGVLGEVVDDPKLMRPLEPPTDLDGRSWFWLYVAIAAGAVLGAVAAFALARRRPRTLPGASGSAIVVRELDTPGKRALARLAAIEKSGVLARDADRKHGYEQMVAVIRDYVGERYRVATRDLTSAELSRRLTGIAPDDERARADAWLARCDIVKYGGLRATRDDATSVLDDARGFVVSTTTAGLADPAREAA